MTALVPVESSVVTFDPCDVFDFAAAHQRVYQHVAALGSGKRGSDSTLRVYRHALELFLAFLEDNDLLPIPEAIAAFLASEKVSHLRSVTQAKYLTPIRLFCKFLSEQPLDFYLLHDAQQMFTVLQLQSAFRAASEYPSPPPDEISYESPILRPDHRKRDGAATWLTLEQVLNLLHSIDQSTLIGRRDYALLVIGFNTALREDEIRRLTLASFQRLESGDYTVRVMGKRGNITPVPCPAHARDAFVSYVDAYNAALPENDPRRIGSRDFIWRGFLKNGTIPADYESAVRPLTNRAISKIVEKRSMAAGTPIAPHDMRRTAALVALKMGMPKEQIRVLLRHKSLTTTERYLWELEDYTGSLLTTYDVRIE